MPKFDSHEAALTAINALVNRLENNKVSPLDSTFELRKQKIEAFQEIARLLKLAEVEKDYSNCIDYLNNLQPLLFSVFFPNITQKLIHNLRNFCTEQSQKTPVRKDKTEDTPYLESNHVIDKKTPSLFQDTNQVMSLLYKRCYQEKLGSIMDEEFFILPPYSKNPSDELLEKKQETFNELYKKVEWFKRPFLIKFLLAYETGIDIIYDAWDDPIYNIQSSPDHPKKFYQIIKTIAAFNYYFSHGIIQGACATKNEIGLLKLSLSEFGCLDYVSPDDVTITFDPFESQDVINTIGSDIKSILPAAQCAKPVSVFFLLQDPKVKPEVQAKDLWEKFEEKRQIERRQTETVIIKTIRGVIGRLITYLRKENNLMQQFTPQQTPNIFRINPEKSKAIWIRPLTLKRQAAISESVWNLMWLVICWRQKNAPMNNLSFELIMYITELSIERNLCKPKNIRQSIENISFFYDKKIAALVDNKPQQGKLQPLF